MIPLDDLTPDEAAILAHLATEDDASLWRATRTELDADEQHEIHVLLDLQNTGEIAESEQARLQALIDRYGWLLVQRAHAYLLLARRGYNVPVQPTSR